MLPACGSAANILAAYNDWVDGFFFTGGCAPASNIADVPALATRLRRAAQHLYRHLRYDGCQDMASCMRLPSPWQYQTI